MLGTNEAFHESFLILNVSRRFVMVLGDEERKQGRLEASRIDRTRTSDQKMEGAQ